jgi:predicted nucleic acid-binding protein
MGFVLDASVSLAWAFADEQNRVADRAETLLKTGGEIAFVPDLWWYEMRNILVVGERRGRISADGTAAFLSDLSELRIEMDAARDDLPLLDLARQHNLAVYDAAYLALALRERLPLATLDKRLQAAATAEGIALLT